MSQRRIDFLDKYKRLLKTFEDATIFLPSDKAEILFVNIHQSPEYGEALQSLFMMSWRTHNLGNPNGKITKGELYAILFAAGLPMGFIAKLLLNGNLAPIRNGVLLHKEEVAFVLNERLKYGNRNNALNPFPYLTEVRRNQSSSIGSRVLDITDLRYRFISQIIKIAYEYGGLMLIRKFRDLSDHIYFIIAYNKEVSSNYF